MEADTAITVACAVPQYTICKDCFTLPSAFPFALSALVGNSNCKQDLIYLNIFIDALSCAILLLRLPDEL